SAGQGNDAAREARDVEAQPPRHGLLRQHEGARLEIFSVLAVVAHTDDITSLHKGRGDIGLATIQVEVAMVDQLAGLGTRITKAEAIDDIIQPRFENLDEVVAGLARAARGLIELAQELALHHAVRAADLLLFTELRTIARELALAGLAVLAGFG